ncbi:MAG: hypothetical protein BGP14_13060 [Sphingobacteriales bacterium 44-15]|nr:MAG: hypothetical protein BGP14_13060 [Sphingobacteriales bacterium 44-15]
MLRNQEISVYPISLFMNGFEEDKNIFPAVIYSSAENILFMPAKENHPTVYNLRNREISDESWNKRPKMLSE